MPVYSLAVLGLADYNNICNYLHLKSYHMMPERCKTLLVEFVDSRGCRKTNIGVDFVIGGVVNICVKDVFAGAL